jgi:hypothetical protein
MAIKVFSVQKPGKDDRIIFKEKANPEIIQPDAKCMRMTFDFLHMIQIIQTAG